MGSINKTKTDMKNLLLFLLMLPIFAVAQPKKAKQIFVHTEKSASDNYTDVITYLIDNVIDIKSHDKDLGLIRTESFSRSNIALTLYCTDSTIRVTGTFKTGMELNLGGVIATDDPMPIENRGMKGSAYRKAFDEMNRFAGKFGDRITYK